MKSSECLSAVQKCFPELEITEVSPLGEGWANWSFESPSGLVFRFPKSASSAAELDAIKPIIEELGEHLDLPMPRYTRQSDWRGLPFVAYPKVPGLPLTRDHLEGSSDPAVLSKQIGTFLTRLHQFPITRLRQEFPQAPEHPWLDQCRELCDEVKEFVLPELPVALGDRIDALFEDFITELSATPINAVFVHGDLEPAHILWDSSTQRITGVIDFDDGGIGDPAWDMRLLLHYYGADALLAILEAYEATPADDFFTRRVHFYSKAGYFQDAISAQKHNNEEWLDRCLYALTDVFR